MLLSPASHAMLRRTSKDRTQSGSPGDLFLLLARVSCPPSMPPLHRALLRSGVAKLLLKRTLGRGINYRAL